MTLLAPVPWAETTASVLVQPSTEKDPGGQQEDFGKSSPLGLLVLVLFFIAVVFLVRSMNKHLRKLPASFDQPEAAPPEEGGPQNAKPEEVAPEGTTTGKAGKRAAARRAAEKKD